MERLYPAVIGQDEDGGVFGVVFPDFPGCVSVGDTLNEAIEMGAEALDLHLSGMLRDGDEIPEPTPLDRVRLEPGEEGFSIVPIPVDVPEEMPSARAD